MSLPLVVEVINALENPSTETSAISQKINTLSTSELNNFRQELLVKLAEKKQLELNVLSAVAESVEFVPYSVSQLQEYIDENEESYEDIREEMIYDDSAFTAEGIIDRCIATIAELLGLEDFDADFVADNRDDIIDECIALDGCEDIDDIFSDRSIYNNPVCFVAHWVRIAITEYLKEDDESDGVDNWFDEQEALLLEPYYQIMKRLVLLEVF